MSLLKDHTSQSIIGINMSQFVERPVCPSCGGTNCQEIYNESYNSELLQNYLKEFYSLNEIPLEPFKEANFILKRCLDCSLVYQSSIPNDELMKLVYDGWLGSDDSYQELETSYPISYYSNYLFSVFNIIQQFEDVKNLKFFDFGFGWCNWMNAVRAYGIDVTGVELSEERKKFARNLGYNPIEWDDIPGSNFDYINTDQVFEHLPNPLATIKHLASGLSERGIVRICVPNGDDNIRLLNKMDWKAPKGHPDSLNVVAPLEHINCFTNKAIIEMANKAGLEEVKLALFPRMEVNQGPSLSKGIEDTKQGVRQTLSGLKNKLKSKSAPVPVYEGNSCNLFFKKK